MTALANNTLPTLSASLTDDQLKDYMRRNGQLIFNTKAQATNLYERVLMVDCPKREIHHEWRRFQSRIANARRRGSEAEELRVALEAMAFVVSFVTRWENASLEQRRALWFTDQGFGYQLPSAATVFQDANAMPVAPTFKANNFIGELTKRGIRIDTVKGNITAIPAAALTPKDRELIKLHKGAICAVLSSAEVVA
jgi:hypothetical protein